jgi:type I restriction enzyme, S subunit
MSRENMSLLEQHFDVAFAAPDGIKKLRELILTLAMQGKLVPQDPNDEPASELLRSIEIEKNRLVKEGKIKRLKPLPEINLEELPYDLPKSWEWVRLGKIGELNPRNICDDDKDTGFVPMPLIFAEYRSVHKFESKKWAEIKKGYTHFADGDVAVAKITPCFENRKSCVFNGLPNGIGSGTTELHIFRNTFKAIDPEYLLAYFKNPKYISSGISKMTGSAGQKRVPTDFFTSNPFPLPPLAEQRRIVAKIDQLMARCDELEKLRIDRSQRLLTVHTAALDRLLTAKDSSEFSTAWSFITQHFGELYSVKENVIELRKTILQLAVMGKLVQQDPNDEPASELLRSIELEKQRLVKEGKIKKSKPFPEIDREEIPYELPKEWVWARLGDISLFSDSGWSPQCLSEPRSGQEWGVLKVSAVSWGEFRHEENKALPPGIEAKPECEVQVGDFLISRANTEELVARSVLVKASPVRLMMSDKIVRFKLSRKIEKDFINFANLSQFSREYYASKASGTSSSMKNISREVMNNLPIPLPPLAEQRRIVEKIDRLMGLCDRLERSIKSGKSKQTALLNALMSQV